MFLLQGKQHFKRKFASINVNISDVDTNYTSPVMELVTTGFQSCEFRVLDICLGSFLS